MEPLLDYIEDHTERGACRCFACTGKVYATLAPPLHSVDVYFFWVRVRGNPDADTLRELLRLHYPHPVRLEGGPTYIEMGTALGLQELALRLIALGKLVGLWDVITPAAFGYEGAPAQELARSGLVMCTGLKKNKETTTNAT
jgi:hypothetical protein